ncbi:LysR family transcriptional regulator [Paraburkholderia megapolitana]|uniref:Transcriptional regulator, LysR family n=1 Tax=Paraburkholderia megapolitana TaxID=420953 RepID=A0A1I3P008_9BURK|nr:LysR family transcriptional regulator [Paraburkholderia megapolitana]QDQ84547.1 LysR family transcriptional regulator [Paraburkholderia megapolitana]SFJ14620.1 transcriptional regulator, LysR family [Paraburkholderia megapolitana]
MLRENVSDLLAFIAVAREGSFTRAAATLGVSQSALSHALRALEARMGVRLLSRTTRSVAPTAAGERLMHAIAPRFDEIESELAAIIETREKPAGTIRITTTDYAADTVLWPRLAKVLPNYPDIKVEMVVDYGLSDIVADRYDIGVRWGDQVAKDMIAVRVGPRARLAIVGSPAYLAKHPAPVRPKDLLNHNCIKLRLPTRGGLYAWELKKGKREIQVRVDGQLTFNGVYQMLNAAIDGAGLAFVPEDLAEPHVSAGRLRWVLEDWFPTFSGLHIFYPSRREYSRALSVVVDAIRNGG